MLDEEEDIAIESSIQMILNKPALIFDSTTLGKTILIADLHMGFIYGKNKKGIILPQSKRPEEELIELVKQLKPEHVIILGDFKDEIFGTNNPLVGRIFDFMKKIHPLTKLIIIKGNHDGKIEEILPESVEIIPPTGLFLKLVDGKTLGLWHGHASSSLDVFNADITITAHCHPAYTFRDEIGARITEKVWIKAKWLHTEGKKERLHIIIPAFNSYIEGYSVDGEFFKTIISMKDAINFEEAEVFTLEGVLLGTIANLQNERKLYDEKIKIGRKKKEY
ncbi:MAG: metallophosphoesterase [Candidatus Heimdallarchaeota archaeon]|nr:metallophosphoesterase [Candidatus Heimdallarchaeota archaeon]